MADAIDKALVDRLDRDATYAAILSIAVRVREIDRAIAVWETSRMLGRTRFQPHVGGER